MNSENINTSEWIGYARKFIISGDHSLLLRAAETCGVPEISDFLRNENVIKGKQVFPKDYQPLLDLLLASDKVDEAAMIEILARRFVAFATREITTYQEDGRIFIYNTCEQLTNLSADRKFIECEAIFAGSL